MKIGMMMAAAASMTIAGSALASGDETFNLGGAILGGGEAAIYDITLGDNNKGISGFSISFDYNGNDTGSWASDTRVILSSPSPRIDRISAVCTRHLALH